ncbi:MAG: hypothetical protein RJA70_698 [Pseudomonadota bacterium]|jgi:molecular chaperone DnaJ
MSDKRDYYEVLELARDASADDIRRNYRKLALKYHPDRNQGDAEAERMFKEATEAFAALSDADKRATYDRYGHAGMSGGFDFSGAGMGDIFNQFQDMFSDFFGAGFSGGGGRQRTERGQSIRVEAAISLKAAMTGTKEEVTVEGSAPCDGCLGSGAEKGSTPDPCVQCGGTGQMTTQRGFIMFASTCTRCGGRGQVIKSPCKTCSGRGAVQKRRRVVVSFPAGIEGGQRLRVPGQGMPGPGGAPAGDLFVDVEVEEDERFKRDGHDLFVLDELTFAEAALGADRIVTLPDDREVTFKVPAGTQPNTEITLRDQGMPVLGKRNMRGSLKVVVGVQVPTKLSRKAKQLLQDLEKELRSSEPD